MITCILSFNHPQLTSKCVTQTLKYVPQDKIILIHNGSRAENIQALQNEFRNIRHFTININKGFTNGANESLKYAFQKSQWVFFLTNDCLLLNTPTAPDQSGLFAPLIYRRSEQKIDSLGAIFYPNKKKLVHIKNKDIAQNWITKKSLPLRKTAKLVKSVTGYFYVPGTAFFIDKKTFEAVGGFDETLHTYWEDVDLSVRAQHAGLQLGIHTQTQIIHKIGKTCHKDPFYTNHLFQKNRKTISQRYGILASILS